MKTREQAADPRRPADQRGGRASGDCHRSPHFDAIPSSPHVGHSTEKLGFTHGRIGNGVGVASRYEPFSRPRDYPVREQPPVASEQDDIAHAGSFGAAMANQKNVTRPNRGKHARACDAKAQFAGGPHDFRRQLGPRQVKTIECRLHEAAAVQELFLLVLQLSCVSLILPQASAMVSKTCSCRKAGFT